MRVGGGLPVATSRAVAREGVTWEVAQQWKCKRPKFGQTSSGGSSALTVTVTVTVTFHTHSWGECHIVPATAAAAAAPPPPHHPITTLALLLLGARHLAGTSWGNPTGFGACISLML